MKTYKSKAKLCAILAGLLCTVALAVACNDTPDGSDTSPETTVSAETTVEVTEEETEKVTEPATEEETTEAETECHLLFEDNFDGAELDNTKWERLSESERENKPSAEKSIWKDDMSYTDGNGHLILQIQYVEGEGILCGAVKTKTPFESGYGYYEASVKFPLAYGISSAFSLTGEKGEVDILRSEASNNGIAYRHSVTDGKNGLQALEASQQNFLNLYDGRFHAFGVLANESGYTFYIDGVESGRADASAIQNGRLTLNSLAPRALGAATLACRDNLLQAQKIVVDYVRAYSSLPETFGKAVNTEPELLLTEDFDGTEIDFTKWKYAPEWTRNDYCYWSNEMSVLDGEGHLATKMEWDPEVNRLKSGALWSAADYGYGYYEASIKFPKAYGTWGAFWMMCGDVWMESAADGVEIDIVESINNHDGLYQHALHSNYASLNSLGPEKLFTTDIYDGAFHTFGVLRAENGYFFYVDRKLSAIVPYYQYTPCPIPGRMELTVEADSWVGAGTPECLAQLPAQMLTDSVRVWDSMPDLDQ